MRANIIFAMGLVLLASSCFNIGGKRVKGNGNVSTQSRSTTAFKNIHQSGPFDVYVSNGPFQVKVEAEENLLPYIITEVNGNSLTIHTRENIRISSTRQVKIFVSAPLINKVGSSGSGNLYSQSALVNNENISFETTGSADIDVEVDAPEVKAGITGSGDIHIKGSTKKFEANITGSGDIKASDLKSEDVKIDIAGSGNAEVYASVKLNINVAGSGDVKYKGNAPQINSNMHGSGSLKKMD